jgi:hypothetical protein
LRDVVPALAVATRRELARLVREVVPLLGLSAWRIDVKFDSKLPHAAHCTANPEYREAALWFHPRKIRAHDAVAFVTHELLHCHVWTLATVADTFAGADPAKQEAARQAEELLTAQLDLILVPLIHQRVTGRPAPPLVRVA